MTPPPMITALPEGLRGAVDEAAKLAYHENYPPDCGCVAWGDTTKFLRECYRAKSRKYILAFLNAALDAGVAREIPDDQALIAYAVFDDKFPALIIRTGP